MQVIHFDIEGFSTSSLWVTLIVIQAFYLFIYFTHSCEQKSLLVPQVVYCFGESQRGQADIVLSNLTQ